MTWERTNHFDKRGARLADGHYSRRKVGSPQFAPPGERIVLVAGELAVWVWWRPHPRSGIRAMNGLDGWTCTLFRNIGAGRSSDLVLEAEEILRADDAAGRTAGPCGPDGMMTYVWRAKVKSPNPGYCYKCAGWRLAGRSADGRKDLLRKPFEHAGAAVQALLGYQPK